MFSSTVKAEEKYFAALGDVAREGKGKKKKSLE